MLTTEAMIADAPDDKGGETTAWAAWAAAWAAWVWECSQRENHLRKRVD